MSNLTSFIVLAGLLFFPGRAPAAEKEPIGALCARRDLQALREAQGPLALGHNRTRGVGSGRRRGQDLGRGRAAATAPWRGTGLLALPPLRPKVLCAIRRPGWPRWPSYRL